MWFIIEASSRSSEDGTRISERESAEAGQTFRYLDFSNLETVHYGYEIIGVSRIITIPITRFM